MRRLLPSLLCLCLLTGCSGQPETVQEWDDAPPLAQTETAAAELLHITVEQAEISLARLQEQGYTVPVQVKLTKNPGILAAEWGLQVDTRCRFTVEEGEDFHTYTSCDAESGCLWAAWLSGGETFTDTGTLLTVQVTLPADAQTGDSFAVSYAAVSPTGKPHVWLADTDLAYGAVWEDGGITVTDS